MGKPHAYLRVNSRNINGAGEEYFRFYIKPGSLGLLLWVIEKFFSIKK